MKSILALVLPLALLLPAGAASARDRIQIVGSSTVFPFSTAVAERFGRGSGFKTPVVEQTGSGGGIKLFCGGGGHTHTDITNSSRRIKASEVALCESNGVDEIVEIRIGYDGIVLANSRKAERYSLTKEQVFRALAKRVPINGTLVDNPYERWSEIDPALPDTGIEVLGPPPTSGTRDAFVELAMEGGARALPTLAALEESDPEAFKVAAHSIREDGHYVEAGENDNLIVQKLEANPRALGVFGFSFLDQNADKMQGSLINGVEPTFDLIASGAYGVSRSLYFYVKKAHVGRVPGLKEFIAEFLSERAAGEFGYLSEKGLIPLPKAEREQVREIGENLALLSL